MTRVSLLTTLLVIFRLCGAAAAQEAEKLHAAADEAMHNEKPAEAVRLMTRAIELNSNDLRAYMVRGQAHAFGRNWPAAEADFTVVINNRPDEAGGYASRGGARLAQGKIEGSRADFDKLIALRPPSMPHLWQRGIALYYAGDYEKGQQQFEAHQAVNPNDVENAAWHYLCVARAHGVAAARRQLIPIQNDARIPMTEVHELYAGKKTPAEVLAAAEAVKDAGRRNEALFYAHLYIALFYEAAGETQAAGEHMSKAAATKEIDHYMHDVAKAHVKLREKQPAKKDADTR